MLNYVTLFVLHVCICIHVCTMIFGVNSCPCHEGPPVMRGHLSSNSGITLSQVLLYIGSAYLQPVWTQLRVPSEVVLT